jgi:hypothetical protein
MNKVNSFTSIFLISFVLLTYWLSEIFYAQHDDSFITYRFAYNLLNFGQFTYDFEQSTDSASSYIYTLFLLILEIIGFEPFYAGPVIGLLSFIILVFYINHKIQVGSDSLNLKILFSFFVTFNFMSVLWVPSGMETLPWTLINIYLFFKWRARQLNSLLPIMLLAMLPFVRFEGILIPLFVLVDIVFRERNLLKSKLFLSLIIIVVIFTSIYFYKYTYQGILISHAYMMKEVHSYYASAPFFLIKGLIIYYPILLFSLITLPQEMRDNPFQSLYVIVALAIVIIGPYSDYYRYSFHLVYLLLPFSFFGFLSVMQSYKFGNVLKPILVVAFLFIPSFYGIYNSALLSMETRTMMDCRAKVGKFINENININEWILSGDIGAISYFAENNRFIDMVGLTSPDVLSNYLVGFGPQSIIQERGASYIADTFFDQEKHENLKSAQSFFGIETSEDNFKVKNDFLYKCDVDPYRFVGLTQIEAND